jgi:hypothetical protein
MDGEERVTGKLNFSLSLSLAAWLCAFIEVPACVHVDVSVCHVCVLLFN